jgi:hypothetical protein
MPVTILNAREQAETWVRKKESNVIEANTSLINSMEVMNLPTMILLHEGLAHQKMREIIGK